MAQAIETYIVAADSEIENAGQGVASNIATVYIFLAQGVYTLKFKDFAGNVKTLKDSTNANCSFQ